MFLYKKQFLLIFSFLSIPIELWESTAAILRQYAGYVYFCSLKYDGAGCRRCSKLMALTQINSTCNFFLVIVGDNDAKSKPIKHICRQFQKFRDEILPVEVKFAEHMRGKDLSQELIATNMHFRNQLGYLSKSTRVIRR